jgi:spore coat polysaccharide biosynthesis protein SpsF (cytidylyltransferase family)
MIPPDGGLADGIRELSSAENIGKRCREATAWVEEALAVVKTAPDNPYADDEAIAGAILEKIEKRKT